METFQDLSSIEQLQKELKARYTFEDIVGYSAPMKKLFELLPQIAASTSTVLIEGASGTGKELFARAIHHLSPRRSKPFVTVNCGALPDTLLESELFGHKAGAFTDARRDKPGRFALASGGTIFLDEIGDVSPAMQVRLLRVLQERTIEPWLGGTDEGRRARGGRHPPRSRPTGPGRGVPRRSLLRVHVVSLRLPASASGARHPLLVEHLVGKFNRIQGREIEGVSEEVMARLMEYEYPGNVRELENILEQAFVLCRGRMIELHHLPAELRPAPPDGGNPMSLKAMEKLMISAALRRHRGSRRRTAAQLGIDPSTLYRKMKALKIEY